MEDRLPKTIVVIGGTGSFGQAMTRFILKETSAVIRIISRDEMKQSLMKKEFFPYSERIRFMIGDIRDYQRLHMAFAGAELVFHGAALKHIDAGEYDPEEFVKTNIIGSQNIIHACIANGVRKSVFLSSDKAVKNISLYGATKAVSERLWSRANGYSPKGTEFIILRYGNVLASRGSVVPLFRQCIVENKPLPITDLSMSRFFISLGEAVALAWFASQHAPRGSIMLPHLPAYTMNNLVQAVCEESGKEHVAMEYVGVRAGEKFHEELATDGEAARVVEYCHKNRKYYCIPPAFPSWEMADKGIWSTEDGGAWLEKPLAHPYNSETWPYRLGVPELRERLRGE